MKTFLLVACILLWATISSKVTAQDRVEALDSVLTLLHERELFSGVVLIADNGDIVYSGVFGQAPDGTPVTPQTPLYLASVTKPFTAAAVMMLAAEERIDYDAPIATYIPELPYDDVMIRHLLNHTSGVHFLTLINATWDTTQVLRNDDLLKLTALHRPEPTFEPGTRFAYSNEGYVLLASLIERVSGLPYEVFLRERIFEPLGMDRAYIEQGTEESASGWLQWEGGSGIVASAEDLLAFDRALQPGRLFSAAELEEAYTRPVLPDGSLGEAGFGWRVADGPERRVFHPGEGRTVKSGVQRYLDRGITFVILQTAHGPYFYKVFGAVTALWFGEPYELPEKRVVADVNPTMYEDYVGVYDTAFGRLNITVEDGKLFLEPEGAGGSEELIPSSETTFYFGHQDINWEFFKDEMGRVIGLGFQGQPETMGKKVE